MDAGMRTQVLNWMNKGTTESLSAVCMNRGQRESVRSCRGSEIQQAVMKASIRFPGQKSRLFKGSICRVLRAQGRCSAGSSVTRTEAPGAGAGGGPGRGTWQTVCSPYSSQPILCLALVQVGGCTNSIPAFRLLI